MGFRPEYPSLPTRSPTPAYQAVVRGYNLTNVTIDAAPGGMLDCGVIHDSPIHDSPAHDSPMTAG